MSKKRHSAIEVAKALLYSAAQDRMKINHLKLQKLLYLLQGWCLYFLNHKFFDDKIEAQKYGPIIPSIWYTYGEYKNDVIGDSGEPISQLDFKEEELLKEVWRVYKNYDSLELSQMVLNLFGNYSFQLTPRISPKNIKAQFQKLVRESHES